MVQIGISFINYVFLFVKLGKNLSFLPTKYKNRVFSYICSQYALILPYRIDGKSVQMIFQFYENQFPGLRLLCKIHPFNAIFVTAAKSKNIFLIFWNQGSGLKSLVIKLRTLLPFQSLNIKLAEPVNMIICYYVHAADDEN